MKYKGMLSHAATVTSFVVFIMLGLACASTPPGALVLLELSDRYRAMPLPPTGSERIIDKVEATGPKVYNHSDDWVPYNHSFAPVPLGGKSYEEYGETKRHPDEPIMDQLLKEAEKKYPNETVTIRNASLVGYRHYNSKAQSDGRTFFDCHSYCTADVVIAEPMPQPITYLNNITLEGQSRNDLYRRVNRELGDFRQPSARIEVQTADFDLGRIRGRYVFTVNTGQAYIITAPFTIDILDGSAQISFVNPSLQRSSRSAEEPIFLQSTADLVRSELTTFANNLISNITSR